MYIENFKIYLSIQKICLKVRSIIYSLISIISPNFVSQISTKNIEKSKYQNFTIKNIKKLLQLGDQGEERNKHKKITVIKIKLDLFCRFQRILVILFKINVYI